MKFLIDAQLPRRMVGWLTAAGAQARHSLDLPGGNLTTDAQLIVVAEDEGRIIVTKDADFVNSHLLVGRPSRPLLISTGNISNVELERLLVPLIPDLIRGFQSGEFLELGRSGLIILS